MGTRFSSLQDGEKAERKDMVRDWEGSGSVDPAIAVSLALQTIFLAILLDCIG
jgi:hypothetical protein